jgi:hypothetical protein
MNTNYTPVEYTLGNASVLGEGITNIGAMWWPAALPPSNGVSKTGMAHLTLSWETGNLLKMSISRSSDSGQLYLLRSWSRHDFSPLSKPEPLAEADRFRLEIDVDAKKGQVVFWLNDKGYDMGRINGFTGGAVQALWGIVAKPSHPIIANGKFTDCSYATAKGWKPCAFKPANIQRVNFGNDYRFDLLSETSLIFTSKS